MMCLLDNVGMFSTDMYTKQAVKTIKEHNSSIPLFMMVSYQSPHNPISTPPAQYMKYYANVDIDHKDRAGTVTALSYGVQRIVDELRRSGLYNESFILFSSDNGGAGKTLNYPLKGRKNQV